MRGGFVVEALERRKKEHRVEDAARLPAAVTGIAPTRASLSPDRSPRHGASGSTYPARAKTFVPLRSDRTFSSWKRPGRPVRDGLKVRT